MILYLLPDGEVEEEDLCELENWVKGELPFDTRRLDPMPIPEGAHNPERDQYDGTIMLRAALDGCPPDATRLLMVTEKDLFIPMLTFIVGQAQLDGTVAIVSLARLRSEFHGLPANRRLLVERYLKEALHELGHTFGLTHCRDKGCVMSLSITTEHIDRKRGEMCHSCHIRVLDKLDTLCREAGAAED